MNITSKLIESPLDLLEADIIDIQRCSPFPNSAKALQACYSGLERAAYLTIIEINDFWDAPEREDWSGWKHSSNHDKIGEQLWNWLWWKCSDIIKSLSFGDSPDFLGEFCNGSWFSGDIGKVSPLAFMLTAGGRFRANDLWVSILDDGARQVIIEPVYNVSAWRQKSMLDRIGA